MACQAALHPYLGIVAGSRRQEDCRSRSGDTNQAARLAIGEPGGGYRCKGQARVRGLWREGKLSTCFGLVFPHAARNAKPPGLPEEVQTVSERLPWESL